MAPIPSQSSELRLDSLKPIGLPKVLGFPPKALVSCPHDVRRCRRAFSACPHLPISPSPESNAPAASLMQGGLPEDDRAALLGHEDERITSRVYGHDGPGLHRLQAIIEKLIYAR